MSPIILVSIIAIGLILAIIAIILILKATSKQPTTSNNSTTSEKKGFDFDELMKVVQNPNTTTNELLEVLKLFNQYFRLDEENANSYLIFLSKCLTHKNVNAKVFSFFHNEIKSNNPKYKTELETIEMKALG